MRTSKQGKDFVVKHEGVVLNAYRCPAGVWTIGVGHTAAAGGLVPKAGMRITREQAMNLLDADLAKFERRVASRMGQVQQHVFDGSVSFDFNTGRIHNASWVGHWLSGATARARTSFMSWNKGGGKVLAGLVRRRNEEWRVITLADYGAPAPTKAASLYTVVEYGPKLAELGYTEVRTFQRDNGLLVDGLVGPATWATLERRLAEKKAKIAIPTAGAGAGTVGGVTEITPDATAVDVVSTAGPVFAAVVILGAAAFFAWHFRGVIRDQFLSLLKKVGIA